MSEPPPRLDDDLETIGAELARRRTRLVYLNLLILLLPLAAAATFLAFGRGDRTWVQDEVTETVEETVPSKVKATVAETLPATMREALAEAGVEQRLEALEARLAPPAASGEPGAQVPSVSPSPSPSARPPASPELLARVEALEALRPRLEVVEAGLDRLVRPGGVLERPRLDLAQREVLERLQKADEELRKIPPDLMARLARLDGIDGRLKDLEAQKLLEKVEKLRQDLDMLRRDLEDLERTSKGRIKTVEKSAFRSLTREDDMVTIPGLEVVVRTGKIDHQSNTLTTLTVQPLDAQPIALPPPVRLGQALPFNHGACDYQVRVRRLTRFRIPKVRDHLEILLERECPNQG